MTYIKIQGGIGSEDIQKLKQKGSIILINEDNPLKLYVQNLVDDFGVNTDINRKSFKIQKKQEKTSINLISSVYTDSIMYMIYWYNRLNKKPHEQKEIINSLKSYLGVDEKYINIIIKDTEFKNKGIEFVENKMVSKKTVDIVLYRENNGQKEIGIIERNWFPVGSALPGGFILDEDESNPLDLPSHIFAALRVGGQKILSEKEVIYGKEKNRKNKEFYFVSNQSGTKKLKLFLEDLKGYSYKDYLERMILPSDPRHIVDTTGFEMEFEGEELKDIKRISKNEIMNPDNKQGGFVFNHHREIVAHLSSRTSLEKERDFNHSQRIRNIINNPEQIYNEIKTRFNKNNNSPETSMPELFPVVDKIKKSLFNDKINNLCKNNPVLLAMRDNVDNSLTHISFKNRVFCPYESTIRAIYDGIKFYDIVARLEKQFYEHCNTEGPIQHNPKDIDNALYHTYRYEYRYNEMMGMIPDEIIIPTFEYLGATDIMKIRGVPLRFVGLSEDFIYVDEFLQSPKEFFMHDVNHSYRMAMEDIQFSKKLGLSREQLYNQSNKFLTSYLQSIKVKSTDSKEEKEIKKLKKIILFEIIHEDARPCLPEVVCEYLQQIEGNSVPFEVPTIKEDGYRDVTDLMDTGISTLSYVRNKLQHGFYDEVDSQIPQIVDPEYRYAKWIAKAAYDMLVELKAKPVPNSELDEKGNVSIEWLLYRVCAVGPDNIHNAKYEDPDMKKYGDGAKLLNPKRYQVD
ncbi:hypothetical protein XF24_00281 [candidate division SR1 bacterium Aalborg_AAW-1]|nr:hypothetical protein XF24_00281 [candidate division SR1 bacterium Aalborg_AAW-1]